MDETVCSVPDLEEIPNPDSTDYPSFPGQNYENRDCTRVLRSNVSKSSFHPLYSMLNFIIHLFKDHPFLRNALNK